jgi:hypothetical protein
MHGNIERNNGECDGEKMYGNGNAGDAYNAENKPNATVENHTGPFC